MGSTGGEATTPPRSDIASPARDHPEVLLRRDVLDGIATGEVTLAFRRWRRPTVKAGGRLRTAIGELTIDAVEVVDPTTITEADAAAAGAPSRAALTAFLDSRPDGLVYRVELHLAGPDPRVARRADDQLDAADLEMLRARLARIDAASRHSPWTVATLRLIEANPGRRAPDLAAEMGRETAPFKAGVRHLKELGLTESLAVGYRLSPRGAAALAALDP